MNLHPPIRLSKSVADRAVGSIGTPSAKALGAREAYRLGAARQQPWGVFSSRRAEKIGIPAKRRQIEEAAAGSPIPLADAHQGRDCRWRLQEAECHD